MNFINQRGLFASKSIFRALPRPSQVRFSRSNALQGTTDKNVITDKNGKVVLYRGPPAMKPWIYYFIGGTFMVIGVELAYDVYNHFCWPLFSKDPNRKPELVSEKKRTVGAVLAGTIGLITASLFFMVPSSNITRLTLDLPKRQLILRTAVRGFSALPPRAIYPTALRKTAELRGFYLTPFNNERVVPLASVYRVRGSASPLSGPRNDSGSGSQKAIFVRHKGNNSKTVQRYDIPTHYKHSIEIRVGEGRFWYTIEAFGGVPIDQFVKSNTSRYARFWQRISYWMRGSTDWTDVSKEEMEAILSDSSAPGKEASPSTTKLGPKQPWFSDRQTFDDVIPLVKRK
ncbi:uncharacterized protein FA14DRAFT_161853 [Meira miltonrushii]|uniref:Uncharacterized protein n=1 Tax=Meira miltonrushii TaxID=1280837 RepID=A0A316VAD4_9BASI|nr:uncharacterized protein FA14DRAFT_161853 [Meira miltonrushii]PWN34476.1 hypothetical protein FA14DRAFT_161853 [Meira miltonrushii]